jgi:hypothetical protein
MQAWYWLLCITRCFLPAAKLSSRRATSSYAFLPQRARVRSFQRSLVQIMDVTEESGKALEKELAPKVLFCKVRVLLRAFQLADCFCADRRDG